MASYVERRDFYGHQCIPALRDIEDHEARACAVGNDKIAAVSESDISRWVERGMLKDVKEKNPGDGKYLDFSNALDADVY